MAKFNRNFKLEIMQKRIERQGELSGYKPWLPIGIKASLGPVTRVPGNKTNYLGVLRQSDSSLGEGEIEVKPTNELDSGEKLDS